MIKHLKPIINLLNLAKEILESNLDQKLTTVVEINNYNQIQHLPPELDNKINQFTTSLTADLHITESETEEYLNSIQPTTSQDEAIKKESQQLHENINQAQNQAIKQGVALFNQLIDLQLQQTEQHLAQKQYQAEFNIIKKYFKKQLDKIDNKSSYLRNVLKHINTAHDNKTLKEGLMLLSDLNENQLSDNDFQNFLDGKQTINI